MEHDAADPAFPETPVTPESQRPWYSLWLYALSHPSVDAYREIANHPNAKGETAFLWVLLSTFVGYIINLILSAPLNFLMATSNDPASGITSVLASGFGGLICQLPMLLAMSVGLFAMGTGVPHLVASRFGSGGSFAKLAYVYAAYTAPLTILVLAIPFIGTFCLSVPIALYGFFLSVVSVRAVYGIGTGSAIVANLSRWVALIVIIIGFFCLFFAGIMLFAASFS